MQLPKARHRAKQISKEIGKRGKQPLRDVGAVVAAILVVAVAKQHVRLCPQRLSKNNLHACLPQIGRAGTKEAGA